MATLSTLRTNVRNRLYEPSADFFTDAELNTYLNDGYKNFCSRTLWCEKIKAISPVVSQYEYDLPTDTIFLNLVKWDDRWKVLERDLEEFSRFVSTANLTSQERPFIYRIWGDRIRLYPIPNTIISTTLNGTLSSTTATTITVNSTASFPSSGRINILNEQILYTGKTATTFTGCVRGDEFSAATVASDTTPVYFGRLQLYVSYMPPDMTNVIDSRVGPVFDEALVSYAVSIALTKRDKYQEAGYYMKNYENLVLQAKGQAAEQQRDRLHAIKDDDGDYSGSLW